MSLERVRVTEGVDNVALAVYTELASAGKRAFTEFGKYYRERGGTRSSAIRI